MLAAPSSVASSPSAECDRRSLSREVGVLPRTAPTLALHGLLSCAIGSLVESVVVPGRVPGLASRALTPRTVRCTLAGTLHAPPLPVCGLGGPGRGLWTAISLVGFARALGVTICGLDECTCTLLAVTRPGVTVRSHTGPATGHCHFSPLTVRGLGIGVGGLGGVAGIALRLFCLPGSQQLWVEGGACPCGGGQLHPPAHTFSA